MTTHIRAQQFSVESDLARVHRAWASRYPQHKISRVAGFLHGRWLGFAAGLIASFGVPEARAHTGGTSIGLNFASTDPSSTASSLGVAEVAGVVASANWNNLANASGSSTAISMDRRGSRLATSTRVTWASPSTWRSGANNAFPAGPNRKLMSGYLDTSNTAATGVSISVTGLPAEFANSGYDVYVYFVSDSRENRGGAYTLTNGGRVIRKYGSTMSLPNSFKEDPGTDANNALDGNYLKYTDLSGTGFSLKTDSTLTTPNGFRAPVAAIEIVAHNALTENLPLGTEHFHSAGIFRVERFDQTAPETLKVPAGAGARFLAYAFAEPEPNYVASPRFMYGWNGVEFGQSFETTPYQPGVSQYGGDYFDRIYTFERGLIPIFPEPPDVYFPTLAAMNEAFPDQGYQFTFQMSDESNFLIPIGAILLNTATTGTAATAPVIENFARLQAWPRNEPLELRWRKIAGAGDGDFIQVMIQRNVQLRPGDPTGTPFIMITPLGAEPGALRGSDTNIISEASLNTLADGSFATVTFFNVLQVNTQGYPGCVGIAGVAGETTVPIHFVDPIKPVISVADVSHTEGTSGDSTLHFEINLSQPSNTTVSVQYATADETAHAGEDYQSTSGTLLFAPGETTKTVSVALVTDTSQESDETFKLLLSAPVIGTLGRPAANGMILNDDSSAGNLPPIIAQTMEDQTAVYGTPFNFAFVADAFTDPDAGQTLLYSTDVLPAWLTFTPISRAFSGTPNTVGKVSITVTATDNGSPAMSVEDTFDIAIGLAPLNVKADNQSRPYGATNPPLTLSYAGFVLGENANELNTPPTADTGATSASATGHYPITVGGGADDHYTLQYSNGTLSITPAPLIVTANAATRFVGEANPTFSGTLEGVANEDAITASFTTTAATDSPPGEYPIEPQLNDPEGRLSNYNVSIVNGTLTILGAPVVVISGSGVNDEPITVSWPITSPEFQLEFTESLTPPENWQRVIDGIVEQNGTRIFSIKSDASAALRLYRLRRSQ